MLTVICPSRGRPDAAAEVMKTFEATVTDLDTKLWFIVDPDDPTAGDYPNDLEEPTVQTYQLLEKLPLSGMLPPLNKAITIREIVGKKVTVVGFVGDDHRFRTPGWDAAIVDYLEAHPGIAYGDDLLKGAELPTQWFVSRPIVDVFGMGLPALRHLYIDNYWKALGSAAGCLYYMPEIVIEHMHPTVGKGEWDDSYRANNSGAMYAADSSVYTEWYHQRLVMDAETLRGIVG